MKGQRKLKKAVSFVYLECEHKRNDFSSYCKNIYYIIIIIEWWSSERYRSPGGGGRGGRPSTSRVERTAKKTGHCDRSLCTCIINHSAAALRHWPITHTHTHTHTYKQQTGRAYFV